MLSAGGPNILLSHC